MKKADKTTEQILADMQKQQQTLNALQEVLVTRARLQENAENRFNALVRAIQDGIELVNNIQEGTTIPSEWIAKRDKLIQQVQDAIDETG